MYATRSACGPARKSFEPEHIHVVTTPAGFHEIRHDLANHAAELVTVPGEPSGDAYSWMLRVYIDHEMLVWAVGEQAGSERECRAGRPRKVSRDA